MGGIGAEPGERKAYDLTNEQDLGWTELPDTPIDNDMSPRGMHYDGEFLYLIANRQGGSAFAYQTVYIYAFDATVGLNRPVAPTCRAAMRQPRSPTPTPPGPGRPGHAPIPPSGGWAAAGCSWRPDRRACRPRRP